MDEMLNEFNAGIILDGDSKNLKESATKLVNLLNDSQTPQRCRSLAEKYFSMEDGTNKYLSLYERMIHTSIH